MKLLDISKFTRNPLGVIGLFISLIYSIAGIVFAASVSQLPYSIQLILTIFIVLFPLVILTVFYHLVTLHHNKLYAPGDFKDERLFFRPATNDEVESKRKEEQTDITLQESESVQVKKQVMTYNLRNRIRDFKKIESSAFDFVDTHGQSPWHFSKQFKLRLT